MYFEIYKDTYLVKRGTEILNELSWEHELMTVPTLSVTLPIDYLEYLSGREEFKVHVNDKVFWGIVKDIDVNKAEETIDLEIEHVVSEWEYRQISVNHAIQDGELNVIYKGASTTKANGEAITASDFTLTQKQYDKATQQDLINLAYATAWKTANGEPVAITGVDEVLEVTTTTTDNITSADTVSEKGKVLVNYAKQFIGKTKYVWGGASFKYGCDCSGFTMLVYRHFGINIPHYTGSQAHAGVGVSKNNIQTGDLIIYKPQGKTGHVAIYIDENHIIHCSKNAQANGVQIRTNPWYRPVQTIRRLFGTKYDKSKTRMFHSDGYGAKTLDGTKHKAIFTAYYPANNSMEGGLTDMRGRKLRVKDMTIAVPQEAYDRHLVSYGTQIQISEFKPKYGGYEGKIFTARDTGGALHIEDGVWHVDVLVGSKSAADKFGRRTGEIIIGNGKYHYEGNSKSTSSSSVTYKVTFSTAKGTSITVKMTIGESYQTESAQDASVVDNIGDIYMDKNFAYNGWVMDFQDDSAGRMIDYVYSRQNKLEALTKTMELTDDLFWRVGFTNEKKIEVGKFGKQQPYILSLKKAGLTNIQILEEPTIDYDFNNVINVATVYSEKSDTGMSSMTLREVYNDPSLQIDGFPVVILRADVNNERDYSQYAMQYPKLAPNNELEYAVLDEESIAMEAGYLIEGTYAFTDLAPTNIDSKKVTDKQRKKAAQTAYKAAIRNLKQSRRTYTANLTVTELPSNLNVGDKIRLLYDNKIWNLEACSNYWKKILTMDDWFYIQRISYNISGDGSEVDEIVLSKYIKVDRESSNQ